MLSFKRDTHFLQTSYKYEPAEPIISDKYITFACVKEIVNSAPKSLISNTNAHPKLVHYESQK